MAVFFYFPITIKNTKRQRLSQRGHKNKHFKHMHFNFVFCEICFLNSKNYIPENKFTTNINIKFTKMSKLQ